MKKNSINPCKISIIKTLSYSSVFGFPLSFYEITTNLISQSKFSEKIIKKNLEELVNTRVVRKTKGRYIIAGVKNVDREKRLKKTSEIIEKNKPYIKIVSKIPWIKMIALTGSVANQNADKNADVDILFITESNRLWICRGLVFTVLKIIGKLPTDKSKREICPNIFIEEGSMGWTKKRRNLYVAQNIISMKPYLWKDDIYFKFIKTNNWISKYYPNFIVNASKENKKKKGRKNLLMSFIESFAMKIQISHMRKYITTETVNKKLIHFNKNDSSKGILNSYKKIYKDTVKKLEKDLENRAKIKKPAKDVKNSKSSKKSNEGRKIKGKNKSEMEKKI